jgi:hypothetical protein
MPNTPENLQRKINRIMKIEFLACIEKTPQDPNKYVEFLDRVIIDLDSLKKRYLSGISIATRKGGEKNG